MLEEFCRTAKRDAPGFFIQHLMERGEKVKGYLFRGEWYDVSHKSYLQTFRDGRLVESDERSVVVEKSLGPRLFSRITFLHAGKETGKRRYPAARVYFFLEGEGEVEVGGKKRRVSGRDLLITRPEEPHRIHNPSGVDLIYIDVFEKG
jgi:mannose-6-phosphate isomerase-like protein (cupin superfamily)